MSEIIVQDMTEDFQLKVRGRLTLPITDGDEREIVEQAYQFHARHCDESLCWGIHHLTSALKHARQPNGTDPHSLEESMRRTVHYLISAVDQARRAHGRATHLDDELAVGIGCRILEIGSTKGYVQSALNRWRRSAAGIPERIKDISFAKATVETHLQSWRRNNRFLLNQ